MEEKNTDSQRLFWIGLESYDERYSDIFFGRTEEIAQLSNAIYNNIQTVIYGPSGTGKTSILRAGIFSQSRIKRFMPVYVRLNHDPKAVNARTYTQQIIDAIKEEAASRNIDIDQTLPYVYGDSCASLWEFFRCNEFWSEDNYPVTPLFVLDQFEEMFTLGKNSRLQDDFFDQLSDLVDNKYPAYIREYLSNRDNKHIVYPETINFRCVISLREDFLPRLEEHAETIPALKRNRFSLQCINEEQALEIIMKPQPGLVSEEVAVQIIEKVTNKKYRKDFTIHDKPDIEVEPSILSLFCRELDSKRRERGNNEITAELVNEFGDNIIKDFYISKISALSDDKVQYLESQLLTADGFRDSVALANAYSVGFTDEDVRYLTDNRLVRIEEWDGTKRMELTHDVLCKVALAHRTEREEELRRIEFQRQQEEEKQRILEAEEAKRAEIERKAREDKERIRKRNIKWFVALGSALVLLVLCGFGYYFATEYEIESYYGSYTQKWGWPVGIGKKLSESERQHMPLYYKLSRKGMLSKYNTEVEICSSNPRLPQSGRIVDVCVSPDDVNDQQTKDYLDKLNHVAKIKFEGDDNKVAKETYLDEDGNVLFLINYFHLDNDKSALRTYVTPEGLSMPVNGGHRMLDRVKLTWDSAGRVESMRFYNEKDVCVAGADSICGYRMLYPKDNTTIVYRLDEFGRPLQDSCNAVVITIDDDMIAKTYAKGRSIADASPVEVNGAEGYSRIVEHGDMAELYMAGNDKVVATSQKQRDKKGNVTKITVEGTVAVKMPAVSEFSYDPATGYLTSEKYLTVDGKPFAKYANDVYMKQLAYQNDKLASEVHTATDGSITYAYTVTFENDRTVSRWQDATAAVKDLTRIDSLLADGMRSTAFYANQTTPINHRQIEGIDTLAYHYKLYFKNDTINDCRYFVVDDARQISPLRFREDDYGTVREYSRMLERYDADHNLLSRQVFDENDNIAKSMMYIVQDGQTVGRAVMGVDDTPVRCPNWEWEGFCYYVLYYTKDRSDLFNSVLAVNENGQNSVLWDGADYLFIKIFNYKGQKITKEDGSTIKMSNPYSQHEFVSATDISRQEIAYLHVLSKESQLYKADLRDGDRILALGDWTYQMDKSALQGRWSKIAAGEKLHIKVLRPNQGKWEIIERDVALTPGKKLEEYHVLALTDNELQEFNNIPK